MSRAPGTHRSWTRRHLLAAAAGGAGAWIAGCRSAQAPHAPGEGDAAVFGAREPEGSPPYATAMGTPERPPPTARDLGFETDLPLTPNEAFYVMKRGLVPELDGAKHVLVVDGLVERPVSLSFDEIRSLPSHSLMRTLECIGNAPDGELIGNAVWSGARFSDVLALAGPLPEGIELHLASADGYHTGVSTALAMDPQSFLVWSMNGAPLPPEHGFPLRCLFPGRYGQKQPKWLSGITVLDRRHQGYYERQGWSDEAAIVAKSRLDAPAHRATVRAPLELRGIAFAGASGVARVEILDGDTSVGEAELLQAPSPDTALCWTAWSWTWADPPPGNHVLRARATDGRGRSQQRTRRALLGGEAKEGRGDMHKVTVVVEG